jgi:hypothetical protein
VIVAATASAIRGGGGVTIPFTASINADVTNPDLLRAITQYVTYLDFHLYETTAYMQANPHLFDFLQQVAPGFRVVFGEFGIDRSNGTTPQQRADFYSAVLTIQKNTLQALGGCNWAAVNDQYGLFDYITRTLQTDIAGVWAQFPNI